MAINRFGKAPEFLNVVENDYHGLLSANAEAQGMYDLASVFEHMSQLDRKARDEAPGYKMRVTTREGRRVRRYTPAVYPEYSSVTLPDDTSSKLVVAMAERARRTHNLSLTPWNPIVFWNLTSHNGTDKQVHHDALRQFYAVFGIAEDRLATEPIIDKAGSLHQMRYVMQSPTGLTIIEDQYIEGAETDIYLSSAVRH